jgi:hypothetical protein
MRVIGLGGDERACQGDVALMIFLICPPWQSRFRELRRESNKHPPVGMTRGRTAPEWLICVPARMLAEQTMAGQKAGLRSSTQPSDVARLARDVRSTACKISKL